MARFKITPARQPNALPSRAGASGPPRPTAAVRTHVPKIGRIKKPHRYRPGTVALREIWKWHVKTQLCIPKSNFAK